ncbi:MAG: cysteine synthase A [Acidobacteriota bacterium]|jgi:cysteine synthase
MNGKIYPDICGTIGDTPLVRLNRMVTADMAEVCVKLESFNPAASVKDRIALSMIEAAEKSGDLKAGGQIVEPTSGNTGIGLAMVAARKGYELTLVMPDSMSLERRMLLKAYGARLILTPGENGMKGAIARAEDLVRENPEVFMPSQFQNKANPAAHMRTTAIEILRDTEGSLDGFVAGVGTGGTVTGVGTVLKAVLGPRVSVVAVEPLESAVMSGGEPGKHKIQGIGPGFLPDVLNLDVVDRVMKVSHGEAVACARRLAGEEGILAGISSGAALHAALIVASERGPGKRVVVILPDTGERYLSSGLFPFDDEQ